MALVPPANRKTTLLSVLNATTPFFGQIAGDEDLHLIDVDAIVRTVADSDPIRIGQVRPDRRYSCGIVAAHIGRTEGPLEEVNPARVVS
jgi:hypothetical protein